MIRSSFLPHPSRSELGVATIAILVMTVPLLTAGPVVVSAQDAGTTSVSLETERASIEQGTTTKFDIVVDSVNGGVGAVDGTVELGNSDIGTITEVSLASSAELVETNISDNGTSAQFRGALMDTQNNGSVTVGTVTVRGVAAGDTDVLLSIDSVSDEAGTPYQIGATPDSSLTVTQTRSTVELEITSDVETVETGSTVEFAVTRADTGAPVRANVSIASEVYSTGVSGTTSIEITDAMVSDTATVSAITSKQSTESERFQNATVTLDVGSDEPNSSQPTSSDPPPVPGNGTVVAIEPATATVSPDGQQEFQLVAHNIDQGVGAIDATVTIESSAVATIRDIQPVGSPGIENITIEQDGATATVELALLNTSKASPITVAAITLEGESTGQTEITSDVNALGTTSGSSYTVDTVEPATITVAETGAAQPADTNNTTVVVNLGPMPNGFGQASVTVAAPSGTTITDIEPLLTTNNQFRIANGGVGQRNLTVQSADLAGNVGPTNQTRPLFAVTFDSRPQLAELSVTANEIENDEGNSVSRDRISVAYGSSSMFTAPLPGAAVAHPPSDPDGDGLYEDINGDGEITFEDAVALSFVSAGELNEQEVSALDFDGDGDIDTNDAITLAFQ